MAVSTVISNARPGHRSARVGPDPFQGCLALDWANGQIITLSAASAQSIAFDANNDRVVLCSTGGPTGCWIAVGTNPTASATVAGSLFLSVQQGGVAVYVPAGMLIAALQAGAGGVLSMIPALLAGS